MANTIYQLKKSPTPGAVPSALANGELAINFADGLIFYKNVTGHIVSFSSSGGNYFSSVDADGTLLVADTSGDILNLVAGSNINITGDAGTDTITISATGGGAEVVVSSVAPGSPTANSLWWNTDLGRLLIYYADGDTSQWVDASPTGDVGPPGPTGPFGPKSATVSFPTASEDLTLIYTKQQVTVTRISSVIRSLGDSSVTFTLRKGTARDAAGTEIVTGGLICNQNSSANVVYVLDQPVIDANNFLWLETSDITGSVQEFHLTIDFS
jgi:hypothetical protein